MKGAIRNATLAILATIAVVLIGIAIVSPDRVLADAAPPYGTFPTTTSSFTASTADQTLLAAPGSDMAWRVTSVYWEITTAEANGIATIEDAAGTPVKVLYIPLDTKGSTMQVFLGDGVLCSQNSAVQVDFSGSTGEAVFSIVGHKERVE